MRLVDTLPDVTDRIDVTYTCPSGHAFTRLFAADVQAPDTWDCPHCGKMASAGAVTLVELPVNTGRSHWDMVRERRTDDELSDMLIERLKTLRAK